MRVRALAARDWRNIEEIRLESDADFVVIHGDNAQGKTNILESIWMLATLRSFREYSPGRLVRHGASSATLIAEVTGNSGRRSMKWSRVDGQRKLKIDESTPQSLSDWFQILRAILFCPADGDIIRGQPSRRRQLVDRAAFTANPLHLTLIRDFQRILRQKSTLLKSPSVDRRQLDVWNDELVDIGSKVVLKRLEIVDQLSQSFSEMYDRIAGHDQVSIRMKGIGSNAREPNEVRVEFERRLEEVRNEEIRRQMVLVGPQRDDLIVELNGKSARNFASQGQVRTLVLAFKLAELAAANRRGDHPLFLVDDLTSELDKRRMTRLIGLLADLDSQVWMTTTDPKWLGPLPEERTLNFRINQGMVISP